MTTDILAAWCATVAAEFRHHEHGVTDLSADRDAALVEFALRALADPAMPGSAEVLERVDRLRAVTA